MTDYPAPEQRVRAYLDQEDGLGHPLRKTDLIDGYNGINLSVTDIRDVLNELEEHRQLLIQIDEELDKDEPAHRHITRIRNIMGNHTNENGQTNG